eukprot:gene19932-46493_t
MGSCNSLPESSKATPPARGKAGQQTPRALNGSLQKSFDAKAKDERPDPCPLPLSLLWQSNR